jgi:hypothetical protein
MGECAEVSDRGADTVFLATVLFFHIRRMTH